MRVAGRDSPAGGSGTIQLRTTAVAAARTANRIASLRAAAEAVSTESA